MDTGLLDIIRIGIALGTWHYFWVIVMDETGVERCSECGRRMW